MRSQFILSILCCFTLIASSAFAATDDYFKSLQQIKNPPTGSIAVLPCSISEKKHILLLLMKVKTAFFHNCKLHIEDDGTIYDEYRSSYQIYKGDFSNEGITEYAVIYTGGTMHANTVFVFKLLGNLLVDANLDKIISKDLLKGDDLGPNFYLNIADPFAIVMQGKTYMRFMDYPPHLTYDKSKLKVCTYLWQKDQIILSGPNLTFSPISGKLIKALNCIT